MTLLGFKERFVPKIESREKRHTIRAVSAKTGKCRFKVGDIIQLYRKVRQKDVRKIVDEDPVCTKVQAITIERTPTGSRVTIDNNRLVDSEIIALAAADGFDMPHEFYDFFIPKAPGKFFGHIIHWDWQ